MSINFSKLLAVEIEKKKKTKQKASTTTRTDDEGEECVDANARKADQLMSDDVFFAQFFTRKPIEDWDKYRVRDKRGDCIPGLFYVPEFIHEEEERRIKRAIRTQNEGNWVSSGKRRICNINAASNDENTPLWINALKKTLRETTAMDGQNEANHVLINEYNAPAGIDPHFDGIVYNPHVVILTTTGRALMDFWPKEEEKPAREEKQQEPIAQVLLQPRSLLIYRDEYNDENGAYFLRHGIRHVAADDASNAHPPSVATIVEKGEENVANLSRSALRHSVVFVKKNA